MLKRDFFLHTLDWANLLLLLRHRKKIHTVYYIEHSLPNWLVNSFLYFLTLTKTTILAPSEEHKRLEENVISYADALLRNDSLLAALERFFPIFPFDQSHFLSSVKQHITFPLREDMIVITKAGVFPDRLSTCLLKNKQLLASTTETKLDLQYMQDLTANYWLTTILHFLKKALEPFYLLLRIRRPSLKTPEHYKYIFEQMYSGQSNNPEFYKFYDYFRHRNDVLYVCKSEGCSYYNLLLTDGKPVLVEKITDISFRKYFSWIKRYLKLNYLIFRARSRLPFAVQSIILSIFYRSIYYDWLLSRYPASFLIKTRSDIDPNHPVATGVCNLYGTIHIGYMHGNYPRVSHFAFIDFHIYGIIGKIYKEKTFKDTWPEYPIYKVCGPITVGTEPSTFRNISTLDPIVVSIFISWDSDNNFDWHKQSNLFLQSVVDSLHLHKIDPTKIILRPKGVKVEQLNWIVGTLNVRNVDYEVSHNVHPKTTPAHYTSREQSLVSQWYQSNRLNETFSESSISVLQRSDISITICPDGSSTIIWEAMSLGTRFLVLMPPNQSHPFDSITPELIVRSPTDISNAITFLRSLSATEYYKFIEPLVGSWGKLSNGTLVHDFLESIDQSTADVSVRSDNNSVN